MRKLAELVKENSGRVEEADRSDVVVALAVVAVGIVVGARRGVGIAAVAAGDRTAAD